MSNHNVLLLNRFFNFTPFFFRFSSRFQEIRKESRRSAIQIKVKSQVSKVFWRHAERNSRKMIRPDIVLETPTGTFVLDTKWKILHDVYSDDGDLKQLYTYSLQFEAPHVFLIYPAPAENHIFSHGFFQPSKTSKHHEARPVTQWQVPLLDMNGCMNLCLGGEMLSYIQGISKKQ